MKEQIEYQLATAKETLAKVRELINGINDAILNENFTPNVSQQALINNYLGDGKFLVKEISQLENILKSLK